MTSAYMPAKVEKRQMQKQIYAAENMIWGPVNALDAHPPNDAFFYGSIRQETIGQDRSLIPFNY